MTIEKLEKAKNILNDIEYLKNIHVSNGVHSECAKTPIEPTKEVSDYTFKIHESRAVTLQRAINLKISELQKQFDKL